MISRRVWLASVFAVFVPSAGALGQSSRSTGASAGSDTTRSYREARPIINAVEGTRKRTPPNPDADRQWMGWSIDSMLGSLALFTVYAFIKFRSNPETDEMETFSAAPRKASEHRPDTNTVAGGGGSRTNQKAPARESSLQGQRDVHAQKIGRLLRRL